MGEIFLWEVSLAAHEPLATVTRIGTRSKTGETGWGWGPARAGGSI